MDMIMPQLDIQEKVTVKTTTVTYMSPKLGRLEKVSGIFPLRLFWLKTLRTLQQMTVQT